MLNAHAQFKLDLHLEYRQAIQHHAQRYLGSIWVTWSNQSLLEQELQQQSALTELPCSIVVVAPSQEYNFYKLISCGLSYHPWQNSVGDEHYNELIMCLPPETLIPLDLDSPSSCKQAVNLIQGLLTDPIIGYGCNTLDEQAPYSHVLLHAPYLIKPMHRFIPLPRQLDEIILIGAYPIFESEYLYQQEHSVQALFQQLCQKNQGLMQNQRQVLV